MSSRIEWRSRIRLVDEVVEVLREGIYAGRFAPGTRLRQEELAAQLDVSRTPLREALRILEREGLLEVEQNRGVRVISAEPSTLMAAYELREVIDGLAARLAARKQIAGIGTSLLAIVDRQRKALQPWNAARYTATNVDFHRAIVEAAGNEFVGAQLPLINMTARVFAPVAHVGPERAELAIGEHVEIADAIAEGRDDDAERLARAHIRGTIRSLEAQLAAAAPATESA
jgi:DNA-binding GntR family transcriptional regulator